eukprot:Plantae.Rhodophyta-Purpureofilum_apyrenoidigerum.ctg18029.p1 GENE.Plantae.Rhodophyta-Purpureofilum_apyrenoidigerum.ctg18029~~Plantae.Rhodophyta-Purpureofilum_apyrenoidigerum.ctg18029.p1  ORF type:complete len:509 (+),score=90.91 Plantae.Rhodophyta-Purpureofilum_apyrenoidigerum.ctg18029:52-1527(+)
MDPVRYRPRDTFDTTSFTNNAGNPVFDNTNSLSVGRRGPLLLEDYHLLEKLANFDRERIPERVVHARGVAAKGFFEVTKDISDITCADLFKEVGSRTPLAVRFSTVIHSRHSPETLRDPRGFSVKFYTKEGNWDLVGNNFPVFFVRDGMKFPDMVHALKPNPRTEAQEWWRIWDFFSHHPESAHMFTFLLDDLGIPKDYRHMRGSGVHTFSMLNKQGKQTYVKFHWLPTCGEVNMMDDESIPVGGKDFSHATHDLIENIDQGNFPEWKFYIQTMDPSTENDYDFDPLDATKIWPEDRFPLMEIGRIVLNKNVDNQFLENEQIAFSPSLVVPGISYTQDKLLQTRLFSYSDAQRYRLGGNYLMLPINAPRNAHHNNHYDGVMNFMHREDEVNYWPSNHSKAKEGEEWPIAQGIVQGERKKEMIEKENNFQQAGEHWRSFDDDRRERFVQRVAEKLNEPRVTPEVKSKWLSIWSECDADLGRRISSQVKMNKM